MGDSNDIKGRTIPSWQRVDSSSEPANPTVTVRDSCSSSSQEDPQQQGSQPHLHPSRASLIDQATQFLQDDDIRDAPIDRKTAFLESKGLSSLEIEELLVVPPTEDDSSHDSKKQPVKDLEVSKTMRVVINVLKLSYRRIKSNRHGMTAV